LTPDPPTRPDVLVVGLGPAAALDDYEEEIAALYDVAFDRALRRRRALLERYAGGSPDSAALRHAWIGSPEYWSGVA